MFQSINARSAVVLLLAGAMTTAVAAPSDTDTSFGTQGVTTTPAELAVAQPTSIASDSSGRLYVLVGTSVPAGLLLSQVSISPLAGVTNGGLTTQYQILRYSKDGILDTSFATGGSLTLTSGLITPSGLLTPIGLALDEANQRFLLAGSVTTGVVNGSFTLFEAAVTRIGFNGSADLSFGNAGTAMLPLGPTSEGDAIDLLPDGRILVAADQATSSVTRLNSNGTIDTTFGTGGTATATGVGFGSQTVSAITHDAGGSLYVCGPNNSGNAAATTTPAGVRVGRLTADGDAVTSFDPNGVKEIDLGFNAVCLAIQPHGDGSFSLAAFQPGSLTIARVTATGSLDPSFNGNGLQTGPLATPYYLSPHAIQQSDGKLVLAGSGGGQLITPTGAAGPAGIILTRVAGSPELKPGLSSSSENSGGGGSGGGAVDAITLLLSALAAGLRRRRA